MISLFSSVYTVLPPNPVSFVTTMRNLTENQQMLRPNDRMLPNLTASNVGSADYSRVSEVLLTRLQRGYTLSRWWTQTGEETSAWTRGPLVPLKVPKPAKLYTRYPDCSNTSQDYQILDGETRLMDISYSSAWQLGNLLAISDTAFSAELMRFRSVVRNASSNLTRMNANGMTSASSLITNVRNTVATACKLTAGSAPGTPASATSQGG
jgi:hypothetical protein